MIELPCCVFQRRQNIVSGNTCGKQVEYVFHPHAQPANAWPAAALKGIDRDSMELAHRIFWLNALAPSDFRLRARKAIKVGIACLSWLRSYDRGNIGYALATYNASVDRVDRYKGILPCPEAATT